MGILIGCEELTMEWPSKKVLSDQTIGINEGDRIGVVGKNGDGKSTLLRLIAHRLTPDKGQVVWRGNIHVGYLGQQDTLDDDATVGQEIPLSMYGRPMHAFAVSSMSWWEILIGMLP